MPRTQLTQRDLDILKHVRRHRITTREVLRRWICRTEDATKKVLTALAAPLPSGVLTKNELRKHSEGFYLQTAELGIGRYRYYYLTPLGFNTLGLDKNPPPPPGPQTLPTCYAVLAHCCLTGKKLRVLLGKEDFLPTLERLRAALLPDFPPLNEKGTRFDPRYYIDPEGPRPRLTRIEFDQGGECSRLVDKCHGVARTLRATPLFSALADRGALALCVLTSEEGKRDALRETFDRNPITNVHVATDVIPLLADLVSLDAKNKTRS